MKREQNLFEEVIIFLIALSLAQIILEEVAWFALWPVRVRTTLMLSGFWFDLAFSAEFLYRSIRAMRRRAFGTYFLQELGWIDFLCSLPLLAGVSGPVFLSAVSGSLSDMAVRGGLGILKILKTVRIVRLMKFLRFGGMGGSFYRRAPVCVQRQMTMALSTAMLPIAALSLLSSALLPLLSPGSDAASEASELAARVLRSRILEAQESITLDSLASIEPDILDVSTTDGRNLFRREGYASTHTALDLTEIRNPGSSFVILISLLEKNRSIALSNLSLYAIILSVFLCMIFFYAPYLAKRLTAPLSALVEAREAGAPFPVIEAPRGAEDEEVFILARFLAGKGVKD